MTVLARPGKRRSTKRAKHQIALSKPTEPPPIAMPLPFGETPLPGGSGQPFSTVTVCDARLIRITDSQRVPSVGPGSNGLPARLPLIRPPWPFQRKPQVTEKLVGGRYT